MSNDNRLQSKTLAESSLEDIVHLTNRVGNDWAMARKNSERLELLKATYRAQAMEKYDDGERSEAKIRRLAETDKDYIQFIQNLVDAKAETEKLRIRYESYKNLFEARRSMLSYKKAEMGLI